MHKTEFIERVAEEASGSKSEAQRYFEAVENVIISALKHDEEVQITGFGKLYARKGAAREGVNPKPPWRRSTSRLGRSPPSAREASSRDRSKRL